VNEGRHDLSYGWNDIAGDFIARRHATIGVQTIRRWAQSLPPGASVLDLGCGHGVPIAATLLEQGFQIYGVDASRHMVEEFRSRFPQAHAACEPAEDSSFFNLTFDGAIAVGLMFLLPAEAQRAIIQHVAAALNPGGRFLFTAPTQQVAWPDALTGRESRSLGEEQYRMALAEAGLVLVGEYTDEGENHYYDAARQP
jgi:SAM-dependent methyltransferase